MKVLVVGATGLLGSEVCERLVSGGHRVRALTRATSNPDRLHRLRALGIEIAKGDLKDPKSLEEVCTGLDGLITTASSTFSRQPGDSIESVDQVGTLRLLDAARKGGVKHVVYTSFSGNIDEPSPLRDAKRTVEERLTTSGLAYTILRPSYFMEVWLSPAVGFDYAKGTATIYGEGTAGISWISYRDVAEVAAQSVDKPAARNHILEFGGPKPLSPLAVVQIFERVSGKKFEVTHVPTDSLRQQYAAATDDLQKTFAALMLSYAAGDVVRNSEILRGLPIELTSVEQYAQRVAPGSMPG